MSKYWKRMTNRSWQWFFKNTYRKRPQNSKSMALFPLSISLLLRLEAEIIKMPRSGPCTINDFKQIQIYDLKVLTEVRIKVFKKTKWISILNSLFVVGYIWRFNLSLPIQICSWLDIILALFKIFINCRSMY